MMGTDWRLPGCGSRCTYLTHNPDDHEAAGYRRAVDDLRPRSVSVGALTVDLMANRILVDDRVVTVTSREYEVLAYLARNVGRYCSAHEITRGVWGDAWVESVYDGGHNVRVNLTRVRPKLGPAAALLVNRIGVGYALRISQRDQIGQAS